MALSPDLAERYGVPSRGRRPLVVVLIAVLVAAAAAWLAWVLVFQTRPQVRASCLVRAQAADHAVVGELTVPVTSGPATRRVTATLRTERRATGADVVGCTVQRHRR